MTTRSNHDVLPRDIIRMPNSLKLSQPAPASKQKQAPQEEDSEIAHIDSMRHAPQRIAMGTTLTVHDESTSGQKTHSFTLDCLTERLTVRELIRARIYQEVQDYNQKQPEIFRGLVEPSEAERTLNGYKLKARRKIDWEQQYQRALDAFTRNGFFILVGDRQAENLDEEFVVKADTEVSFVKLVPLVGG